MDDEKILSLKNITKRFGGLVALDNVNIDLYKNEILALVGDNGAGKSTLIKIISGAYQPDGGEIYLNGEKVNFNTPLDSKKAGIETVYQDLALIDSLNITNNLFLGREEEFSLFWGIIKFLKHKSMEDKTKEILKTLGIEMPNIRENVQFLSGGQRQTIPVARSVAFGKKIILLDEPTSALAVSEVEHIIGLIRKLKEKGLSLIIITHNLEHAFAVADRFVVLRVGRKVGERLKEETDVDEIVKMITGGIFVKTSNRH